MRPGECAAAPPPRHHDCRPAALLRGSCGSSRCSAAARGQPSPSSQCAGSSPSCGRPRQNSAARLPRGRAAARRPGRRRGALPCGRSACGRRPRRACWWSFPSPSSGLCCAVRVRGLVDFVSERLATFLLVLLPRFQRSFSSVCGTGGWYKKSLKNCWVADGNRNQFVPFRARLSRGGAEGTRGLPKAPPWKFHV